MPTPVVGKEFYERRLARATKVPEAQRTRDVASFVETAQLHKAVQELLPLTGGGRPALPPPCVSEATQRKVLAALLMCARARYIFPEQPGSEMLAFNHLRPYLADWRPAGWVAEGGRRCPAFEPLAEALCLYSAQNWNLKANALDEMQAARRAVALLADPGSRAAVAHQLEQLTAEARSAMASDSTAFSPASAGRQQASAAPSAGRSPAAGSSAAAEERPAPTPLLSHQQLLCLCHLAVSARAGSLKIGQGDPTYGPSTGLTLPCLSRAGLLDLAAAHQATLQALLCLEPRNPKVAWEAAIAALGSYPPSQLAVDLHLEVVAAAKAYGSDWWVLRGVCDTMAVISGFAPRYKPSSLRAAVAALQEAEAALPRFKRLLPHPTVQSVEGVLPMARATSAAIQAHLRQSDRAQQGAASNTSSGPGNSTGSTGVGASSPAAGTGQQAPPRAADWAGEGPLTDCLPSCSGCDGFALGLRRCADCRRVWYCSRACQKAHWPQHKPECRKA